MSNLMTSPWALGKSNLQINQSDCYGFLYGQRMSYLWPYSFLLYYLSYIILFYKQLLSDCKLNNELTLFHCPSCFSRALQGRSRDKTWSSKLALSIPLCLLPCTLLAKTTSSSPAIAVWLWLLLREEEGGEKKPKWEGVVNFPQLLSRHTHGALLPFPKPCSILP